MAKRKSKGKQRFQATVPAPALNAGMSMGPPKIAPQPMTAPPVARPRPGIQSSNNLAVALAAAKKKPGIL